MKTLDIRLLCHSALACCRLGECASVKAGIEIIAKTNSRSLPVARKPLDQWLGIGGIVVAIILFLMPKTPPIIVFLLIVILLLLIHPLWKFWWIEDSIWRRTFALASLLVSLVLFGRYVWPVTYSNIVMSLGFDMLSNDREKSGGLWILREDYIAPVNAALLVRIANVTDTPVSIKTLAFYLKGSTGTWVENSHDSYYWPIVLLCNRGIDAKRSTQGAIRQWWTF